MSSGSFEKPKKSYVDPSEFDPRNITPYHMKKLKECIERFADFMETCVVTQDGTPKEFQKGLDEGLKRVEILLKQLRKENKNIFKDEDEWNPLV